MRRRIFGWYCTRCGMPQPLGDGVITCRNCGELGLRGFNGHYPRRVVCEQPDCKWTGWIDGVNNDRPTHLRNVHGIAQPCEFCKGTGQRRSKARAAVAGRLPCRICHGAGQWAVYGEPPSPPKETSR